ncbi:MAG: T9SS type A sorting domain-containing protein [Ignavibacteria bacterium]|nr:T9SS type A sorting domain-containing protein [Ignavibacteria bacterium]
MWAIRDNGGISRYRFDPVLPVELLSFVSTVSGSNVVLNWSTSREVNNSGFEIERRDVRGETQDVWKKVGFVNGNGNTAENNNYNFTDRGLRQGIYNYRLKQIDFNGNFAYHNLSDEVIVGSPAKFSLSQNYPNPFNPSTKINYDLPFDANVSLKVFDMTGREVVTLVNEFKTAGYYKADFNASNLSTGVYMYRISADAKGQSYTSEKRMMLIK